MAVHIHTQYCKVLVLLFNSLIVSLTEGELKCEKLERTDSSINSCPEQSLAAERSVKLWISPHSENGVHGAQMILSIFKCLEGVFLPFFPKPKTQKCQKQNGLLCVAFCPNVRYIIHAWLTALPILIRPIGLHYRTK